MTWSTRSRGLYLNAYHDNPNKERLNGLYAALLCGDENPTPGERVEALKRWILAYCENGRSLLHERYQTIKQKAGQVEGLRELESIALELIEMHTRKVRIR